MKAGIAGGGIMGQLMAFSLINAGWQVTLFDRCSTHNCSMAAAGLLSPVAELEKNDRIIFQLGEEALQHHWPKILNQLQKNIYFRQQGSLIISHPRDQSDLTKYISLISTKLSDGRFYQKLNPAELNKLEPEVAKFNVSYYFHSEGQIDNQMLLLALKEYLIEKEIIWLDKAIVTSVKPGEISLEDKKYRFDLVLDCRGLGAKEIFSDLRGVRGELVWLSAPDVSISRPIRFLHPRYNLYIVPRENHTYLVGSSEIESSDFSPISVRTLLELLTATYCVSSNFGEARIIKTVTQCRPALCNNLPKIKYADGFIAINGLYRHGFLIAPTLADEIMQWIRHNKLRNYPTLWEKCA